MDGADGGEEGAAGGESSLVLGASLRLSAFDATIAGCKEDGCSPGTKGRVRRAKLAVDELETQRAIGKLCLQGESLGHVGLVLAVGRGHDLGHAVLIRKEVHDVEEASEVAILEVLADRDEKHGDAGGDANGVLDVEVLILRSVRGYTKAKQQNVQLRHQQRWHPGSSCRHQAPAW